MDDEAYYSIVLRYILQNPVKAGIGSVESYPWSSYSALCGDTGNIRTDFAVDLFGGREKLLVYFSEQNDDLCMEPPTVPIGDRKAAQIIRESLQIESGTQLQSYERTERNRALRVLKEQGLSIRQIERLTGISRGSILKA